MSIVESKGRSNYENVLKVSFSLLNFERPATRQTKEEFDKEKGEEKEKVESLMKQTNDMLAKIDDTMQMLSKASKQKTRANMTKRSKDEEISPVLMGDISVDVPSVAKVVRIFTSSTFTGINKFNNNEKRKIYI